MESLTAKVRRSPIPVNRMAAQVISRGIQYKEPDFKSCVLSDDPLPTRQYPCTSKPEDNLTGIEFGRFSVVGLAEHTASWVVRCACGRFTVRRAKAIRSAMSGDNNEGPSLMCARCDRLERMKAGINSVGMHRNSLQAASLPMYSALQDILSFGLNDHTRQVARDAMGLAETLPPDLRA